MKNLLFAIFLSTPLLSIAQEEIKPAFTLPRSVIKLAPLQFFSNTLELGLESFNKDFSRSFDGSIGFRSGASDFEDGRGLALELGYRKYVSPMKLRVRKDRQFYQGIYYNVAVKGSYFSGTYRDYYYYDPNTGSSYTQDYDQKVKAISPSFTLGLQKTLWQIILLDVYVGGGIRFSDVDSELPDPNYYYGDGIFGPAYDGIYPKIGAKIGVGL
jgi:hypothetical protein